MFGAVCKCAQWSLKDFSWRPKECPRPTGRGWSVSSWDGQLVVSGVSRTEQVGSFPTQPQADTPLLLATPDCWTSGNTPRR